jgi:hypothetical protein
MRGSFAAGLLIGQFAIGSVGAGEGAAIPEGVVDVLAEYCLDCHDAADQKGDLNLDLSTVDWSLSENRALWEKVLVANEQELMPPPKKKQPDREAREALVSWLDSSLLEHTPIGGTLPRRLNQEEYQSTVRSLFGLPQFELPLGFPKDNEFHGFNNLGEGLVLSPPLLEAYSHVAWEIADELYPAETAVEQSSLRKAGPEDLVISFSASTVRGDALRLASRHENIMRSCTWPSRIEVGTSGVYRVTISGSTFRPKSAEPMILEVRARPVAASERSSTGSFRVLKEIPYSSESPRAVSFEAELYAGETVLLRWLNAEMTHDGKVLEKQMREWFARDQRSLAAWQKAVFPDGNPKRPRVTILRGANGWKIVQGHLADPDLDMREATMDSALTKALLVAFENGMTNLADALCHHYFENGPSLEIHGLSVEGPLAIVEGPKDKRRAALRLQLAGVEKGALSDEEYARRLLRNLLPRAFRRPVEEETVEGFMGIAQEHWAAGHSFEEGMHLLIRNILISPRFLYRALGLEEKDEHDLASRLSYFLTQGPPDATLLDLANRKRLSESWVLKREASRLMPTTWNDPMVQSFTRQWLDTGMLPEIMPDPKFGFTPYYVDMARDEVEHFFAAMLRENRPMTDFIDPDFTYTSGVFARNVYGLDMEAKGKSFDAGDRKLRRIALKRGERAGGVLGQSGVMMATANGVDTQPVLRGVWVLENLLGSPPPPPPKNVPALTPDTQGTTNPREMLAAHTTEESCAACHKRIDPVGFVLENYDPVGRWREDWPKGAGKIDPSGTLPDGTPINDVVDFKRWLTANVDQFSQCLAEKLMTYATGRVPNYAERKEIAGIVKANHGSGNGFRDLVLGLVESETFRTR